MDCILCAKTFTREEEFQNYNPNPKVGKNAISKLFQISSDTDVQGLSEDLAVCMGCHLKLEVIEDLLSQFEELKRRIDEAKDEIKQELTNSKDASELIAILSDLELSQTSLDRLVLLKAIESRNTRPTAPVQDKIEAGRSRESSEEQDQATDESESEDLIDSANDRVGVLPAEASMLQSAKICPESVQIPRGSSMVKKQGKSNPVPCNSKGGYALRVPKPPAKPPTQIEESSDEESSSNSESGGGTSSEDDSEDESQAAIRPKGPAGIKRRANDNTRSAFGSNIKEFTPLDNGSFRCKHCSKIVTRKKSLGMHLLMHGPRKFKCSVQDCGKGFTMKSNRDVHVKMVHERKKDFKCSRCKKKFFTLQSLNLHVKSVHEGRKDYKCNWTGCGKSFAQPAQFNSHVKTVHEGRRDFKCGVEDCDKAYISNYKLQKHMSAKHNNMAIEARNSQPHADPVPMAQAEEDGNEPVQGPSRPSTGSNEPERIDEPSGSKTKGGYGLRKRIPAQKRSSDDEDSSESDGESSNEESGSQSESGEGFSSEDDTEGECKASISSNSTAMKRVKNSRRARGSIIKEFIPLEGGSFQCKHCSKIITQKTSLRQHLLIHIPRRFKCSIQGCGKMFILNSKRKRHVKTVHEGKKEFKCTWPGCGKWFGGKCDQIRHMRTIHEGRKDFKCGVKGCGKLFTQKPHLITHVKTVHEGKKDFKCTWRRCGKSFTQLGHLNTHVKRVHESRRDSKCTWEGCGKCFGEKSDLTKHVKTVHEGRKDYKCTWEGCGKSYTRSSHLSTHVKTFHEGRNKLMSGPSQGGSV